MGGVVGQGRWASKTGAAGCGGHKNVALDARRCREIIETHPLDKTKASRSVKSLALVCGAFGLTRERAICEPVTVRFRRHNCTTWALGKACNFHAATRALLLAFK